jgi:hypothetical protein
MCRLSTICWMYFGVPQDSGRGPILPLMYVAEMFDVITASGFIDHSHSGHTRIDSAVRRTSHPTGKSDEAPGGLHHADQVLKVHRPPKAE